MQGLRKLIQNTSAKAISFDVFDTVLMRSSVTPDSIFFEIGKRASDSGLSSLSAESFAKIRYKAEKLARTNANGQEVSLEAIYGEALRAFASPGSIAEWKTLEESCERDALVAIPGLPELLSEARQKFGRIIFISDMYLSEEFLSEILTSQGLFQTGDRLYVSSAEKCQKVDGRLFQRVQKNTNIQPSEWIHVGDNWNADIVQSRRLGLQAFHFTATTPNSAEKAITSNTPPHSFASQLSGSAIKARLRSQAKNPLQQAIWETGTGVTAPILHLYTEWLLQKAHQKGITQLCFLARDAFFPMEVTKQVLASRKDSTFRIHYIHGSRGTYLALGFKKLTEEAWDKLTTYGGKTASSLNALSSAFMSESSQLASAWESLGFSTNDWDRELTARELERIRKEALSETTLHTQLNAALQNHRELFKNYLTQSQFDPTQATALIDTGWTSRSHAPLYNFLQELGCETLNLFYLALLVPEPSIPKEQIEALLFDESRRQGLRHWQMYYPRPFETLLFANHGRTTRFQNTGNTVEPVLNSIENQGFNDTYFETYAKSIETYTQEFLSKPKGISCEGNLAQITFEIVSRFWLAPTKMEATAWSQLDWEWDPQGNTTYPLTRAYTLSDLKTAMTQRRLPECYPQFWVAGSAALTPPKLLALLKLSAKVTSKLRNFAKKLPSPLTALFGKVVKPTSPKTKKAGA